jgi:hypothetical protein
MYSVLIMHFSPVKGSCAIADDTCKKITIADKYEFFIFSVCGSGSNLILDL